MREIVGKSAIRKEDILNLLEERNIGFKVDEHPSVYDMKEVGRIKLSYPEAEAKNLLEKLLPLRCKGWGKGEHQEDDEGPFSETTFLSRGSRTHKIPFAHSRLRPTFRPPE